VRRSKTISLAEAIQDYIEAMKLGRGLGEITLISSWEEITGKAVASRTKKLYIRDGILYVYLSSPVVRNELLMLRQELVRKLNRKAGSEIIKDIVLR
jgi:predicted nucleic acid-binding Zn ribbon protein